MCLAVYLGTSRAVPRRPWKDGVFLGVRNLRPDEAPVRAHLGTVEVCSIEAWEGCGCAFQRGLWPPDDDADREEERRNSASIDAFAELLRDCLRSEPRVVIHACWVGDEASPPTTTREVGLTHFASPVFELAEGELLVLRA